MLDLNLISPVFGADVQQWTPNYNGVNSYVEIPEWVPGAFDLECDLYITDAPNSNWKAILGANHSFQYRQGGFQLDGLASGYVIYVDGVKGGLPKQGFQKVRLVATNLGKSWSASCIGASRDKGKQFKGQISSLKLIDKTNPNNSRFYESIIRSDQMPTTTVLKDKNGDGSTDGTLYNFGTEQPYVPLITE